MKKRDVLSFFLSFRRGIFDGRFGTRFLFLVLKDDTNIAL